MKNEGLLLLGKQNMEIREIEMPQAAPDQVLIKTEYVGICGSDPVSYTHLDVYKRQTPRLGTDPHYF